MVRRKATMTRKISYEKGGSIIWTKKCIIRRELDMEKIFFDEKNILL